MDENYKPGNFESLIERTENDNVKFDVLRKNKPPQVPQVSRESDPITIQKRALK